MRIDTAVTPEMLQAFETVPDLYLILSPELIILTASNAFLKATFKERERIRGKPVFEVFPDNPGLPASDATANLKASLAWALLHRRPHQMALQRYDVPLPEQEGGFQEKYWLPTNTPVLDPEGAVRYIIHKVVDVTAHQRALQVMDALRAESDLLPKAGRAPERQEQASHHHALLQAVLDQAPVAICFFQGPRQVIATANPAMCRLWGRRPEQVLGKTLLEALPELEGQGFDALIQEVYATGLPFEGKEYPGQLRRHGRLENSYFNFVYLPMYNDEGMLLGVLNVAVEVTELVQSRKRAEQSETQLQLLNQDLAAANEGILAANKDLTAANDQLIQTHHVLQHLNQELEDRVAARTRDLQGAKAQIEAERNRLYHLFMQAPAPIMVLDGPQLVCEVVNPASQRIFPDRELLGKPLLEGMPELAGSPIPDILRKVYDTGETFVAREMPLMLARHQGAPPEPIYWTFTYQARQDQHGAVDGVLVFAYDVTDQVEARQRIQESEEKYRSLFQTMDQGFALIEMIFDAEDQPVDYRFLECNQTFERHTGLVGAAGQTARELVPDLEPHWFEIYGKVARTGEPIRFTEGSAAMGRWFEVYAYRLGDGSSRKVSLLFSDITQRRQAEEELKINNLQLTRINNDLDNFIYTASHDLKSPILNIEGLLDALLRDLGDETVASERVQQITGMMQGSVERFKKTIANLTEVVKLQKDNSRAAVLVDVREVVREVLLDLEQEIQGSGAQIEVDLAGCPAIHFSEKNLRSVVYNLLSNALKYRSPERAPRVRVQCQPTAEYLVLSVQDNGLGLDPRRTDQLFTMFKRFHSHVEGSGLGLYMIKRMVENADGRIEVESQPGEGTTFRVFFPR